MAGGGVCCEYLVLGLKKASESKDVRGVGSLGDCRLEREVGLMPKSTFMPLMR